MQPAKTKRATIKDVAKLAGVSIAVVSYVLNNTPGKTLPEETRAKVRHAAEMLHYVPNNAARSMRNDKTMSIGVVTFWEADNTFFTEVLRGIIDRANEFGYSICICSNSRRANSFDYLHSFIQNQVDGIILVAPLEKVPDYDESVHLNKIRECQIPCVIINGLTQQSGFHYVRIDLVQAGYFATESLILRGHRDIAFASALDDNILLLESRKEGYFQCMKDYAVPVTQASVYSPQQIPELLDNIRQGRSSVTAIVANKSDVGHFILKTALEKRIRIPEQLSVIAANTHAYSAFLYPALTTVTLPTVEIGTTAVDTLISPPITETEQYIDITLSCFVCDRDSCRDNT